MLVAHDVLDAIETHLVVISEVGVHEYLEQVVDRQGWVLVFFDQVELVYRQQKLVSRGDRRCWNNAVLYLLAFRLLV